MKGFSPFKPRANSFNYKPRYYDPEKEAREHRREELFGRRSSSVEQSGEYIPGQYIRSRRAARGSRRSDVMRSSRRRIWLMLAIVIALSYLGSLLYPRIIAAFSLSGSEPKVEKVESLNEEFNPYAPITVVPNDYQE